MAHLGGCAERSGGDPHARHHGRHPLRNMRRQQAVYLARPRHEGRLTALGFRLRKRKTSTSKPLSRGSQPVAAATPSEKAIEAARRMLDLARPPWAPDLTSTRKFSSW